MHYGVDALAGLAVGVTVAIALRTVRGWEGASHEVIPVARETESGLAHGAR
jgi:hypothetical protein